MATPSEVPKKRCHDCQVTKPTAEFLAYASGTRAGKLLSVCTRCLSRSEYPPVACKRCGNLRPVSDFDENAEKRNVCRVCLMAHPTDYRKRCTTCSRLYPVVDFHKQTRTAYRIPVCKKCDVKATIAKNKRRPHVVASRRKRHSEKIKAEVYLAYGGARCACCGESELSFLTLDHIHNDGAEWRRKTFRRNKGRGGVSTYHWCKRNNFPPIFQVLCWNCQWGKVLNGGVCPHQKETCNDYPHAGVGPSGPKRFGSAA